MTNYMWLVTNKPAQVQRMLTGHNIECPLKGTVCGSSYQKTCCGEISAQDVIECQSAFADWLIAEHKD